RHQARYVRSLASRVLRVASTMSSYFSRSTGAAYPASHELHTGFAAPLRVSHPTHSDRCFSGNRQRKTERSRVSMDAPEGTQEVGKGNRGRRRLLLIPATFVAGVVAAAGVITGFGVADSSSPGAAVSATASTATASIAQKAASLDAETIYRQDSPGVVDITVT